jgi:hypothetical protein
MQFDSQLEQDFHIHGKFKFDVFGRRTLPEKTFASRYETTEYIYKNNVTITFFYYRGDEFKTFYYYDDGKKLLEKKVFLDSMD